MAEDSRGRLGRFLDELEDDDLRDLIREGLTATKSADVLCAKCGKWTPGPIPDVVSRAKAYEIYANQAKGKPAQALRLEVSGTVGLKAVAEMSAGELANELAVLRAAKALPPADPKEAA